MLTTAQCINLPYLIYSPPCKFISTEQKENKSLFYNDH